MGDEAGVFRQAFDETEQGPLVVGGDLTQRMAGLGIFAGHVDEGAFVEIGHAKPAVEDVEHGQKPALWLLSCRSLGPEPGQPSRIAALQDGDGESFFRAEMLIEAPAGPPGFGQYRVDSDAMNAMTIEKALGGIEKDRATVRRIMGNINRTISLHYTEKTISCHHLGAVVQTRWAMVD